MSKGVSADGEAERAKDRANAGGRDREGDLAEQAALSPPGHSDAAQPGFNAQLCCLLVVSEIV